MKHRAVKFPFTRRWITTFALALAIALSITMLPDVHFGTGSSPTDMLERVEAATRKVIDLGYADPKHIGLAGHSYGGDGAVPDHVRDIRSDRQLQQRPRLL